MEVGVGREHGGLLHAWPPHAGIWGVPGIHAAPSET